MENREKKWILYQNNHIEKRPWDSWIGVEKPVLPKPSDEFVEQIRTLLVNSEKRDKLKRRVYYFIMAEYLSLD